MKNVDKRETVSSKLEFLDYPDALPIRTYMHSVEAFSLHYHPELEILLPLSGSIFVQIQKHTYLLRKGDLIVISPNLLHATEQTEEANHVLALQINCEKFYPMMTGQQDRYHFDCVATQENAVSPQWKEIRSNMCAVFLEMYYKEPGYIQTAAGYIQSILGLLLRYFSCDDEEERTDQQKARKRVARILEYIGTHYMERITLNDIAAREYLSPNHLSSLLRKALGMSFSEYLNSIRLNAYIAAMQSGGDTPLAEIAVQCGFSSPQYAANLFYEQYNTTPGKYRRALQKKSIFKKKALLRRVENSYVSTNELVDTRSLARYIKTPPVQDEGGEEMIQMGESQTIDATAPSMSTYNRSALRTMTIGRAYEGLLGHVQQNIRHLVREIGFTHIRFHGILSDDMMILIPQSNGGLQYSWRMVDMLFDFLVSIGLHPFLELTYMPSLLASGTATVFDWKANITPPSSIGAWKAMVTALIRHCIARYGAQEVDQWYFEVWNEPDYTGISWDGTAQEFFEFFAHTVDAIRMAFPRAKICGPSITSVGIQQKKWVRPFIDFCKVRGIVPCAFTLHAYSEHLDSSCLGVQLVENSLQTADANRPDQLMGQDYVQQLLNAVRTQLGERHSCPLFVTEWNLTLSGRNPINDSMFAGTALLYDALNNDAQDVQLIHWTATDYLEEISPIPRYEFHGGFGLVTIHGIPKPSYWAMWALARLGREIIARFDNGIVTRQGDEYRLLVYNHPKLRESYALTYAKYQEEETVKLDNALRFSWTLDGLGGKWQIRRYHMKASESDAQTLMHCTGMHEPLTEEDVEYLSGQARPVRQDAVVRLMEGEGLKLTFNLQPCEFELVVLQTQL